jgi:hypothetical protein
MLVFGLSACPPPPAGTDAGSAVDGGVVDAGAIDSGPVRPATLDGGSGEGCVEVVHVNTLTARHVLSYRFNGEFVARERTWELDLGADEIIERRHSNEYGPAMRWTLARLDANANGSPELEISRTYSDRIAHRAREAYMLTVDEHEREFEPLGAGVKEFRVFEDVDDDGEFDSIAHTRRNENGSDRSALETLDVDADGTVDWIGQETVNDAGVTLTWEVDEDADGTPETIDTFSHTAVCEDAGCGVDIDVDRLSDGSTDERYRWIWNAEGRISVRHEDEDADGAWDWMNYWTYDDEGRFLRREIDHLPPDGVVDHQDFAEYSDTGELIRLTREDTVGQDDGIMNFRQVIELSNGRPVRITYWDDDELWDGVWDTRRTYSLDERGVLTGGTLQLLASDESVASESSLEVVTVQSCHR